MDDDDSGGDYSSIGFAGWSPNGTDGKTPIGDAVIHRQSVLFSRITLHHFPGLPDDPPGQFWVHTIDGIAGIPGDSGGPLFVQRPDGTRDPIGVLSGISWNLWDCGFYACNYWADITRGGNPQWIRDQVVDSAHGGHSSRWRSQHGKPADFWYGEVDYTGACDNARDPDCDHWYTEHDNCPATANPQQFDSDDDGIGDGCPVPPPSTGPNRCISVEWCGGNVNIECPMVGEDLVLRRLVGGTWKDVSRNATLVGTAIDGYLMSLHDNGGGAAEGTYIVCSENKTGPGPCSEPVHARYDYKACGTGSPGGGGGDICTTCNPGPPRKRVIM